MYEGREFRVRGGIVMFYVEIKTDIGWKQFGSQGFKTEDAANIFIENL